MIFAIKTKTIQTSADTSIDIGLHSEKITNSPFSTSFQMQEAKILAQMHLGEIPNDKGQKLIGLIERKEQETPTISTLATGREIGLPDCSELCKAPLTSLSARLERAFNKQVDYVSEFRQGIPPLKLHGTSGEGLKQLVSTGPREGKIWYARLSSQCNEPRIFTHDLLNISRTAETYSRASESDGGVLILRAAEPHSNTEKYRSRLTDNHYSLCSKYGTGAFAERAIESVNQQDFKKDLIGHLSWKNTPFTLSGLASNIDPQEPGYYIRTDLFYMARAVYLMDAIFKMIQPENRRYGTHMPVNAFEDQKEEWVRKTAIGTDVQYTYPDGFTVIKGENGIRSG